MINKFIRPLIHRLTPYVAGDNPAKVENLIKLNTNENPYPPSMNVQKTLLTYDAGRLRRYPHSDSMELRKKLATKYDLAVENIFVGNGSDEVLAFIFAAFFSSNDESLPLLLPEVSYSFYPSYCNLWNVKFKKIPLRNLRIDLVDYAVERIGVIFANPNAPTACAVHLDEIEQLLQQNTEKLVVIDEAYVDFGAESAIKLLQYPNLIVVKTFSKYYALAGIRLGYCMANHELIVGMNQLKNSFNSYPVDNLASEIGIAALSDEIYYHDITKKIVSSKIQLTQDLQKLSFAVLPSMANFVFARVPDGYNAVDIYQKLKEQNILVRHFNVSPIENYLRISIGTADENDKFIKALISILKKMIPKLNGF